MTENHRSTPQIIEFANDINARNENRVKKDLNAVKSGRQQRIGQRVLETAARIHSLPWKP